MAEGASGGLSQAEIDAAQASRRKKEAAGGGHPSYQGKNRGFVQDTSDYIANPENWKYTGDAGDLVKNFLDPAGLVFDRHKAQQIAGAKADPRAAENRYNQNMAEAMRVVGGLRGQSPENIRLGQQLDAIAKMSRAGVRSGGPLGVASGLGQTGRAQVSSTKASAAEILNDEQKMTDVLNGLYGDEEQYKWIRALEESKRLGTITAINLGLLADAKARMAQRVATAGVTGAKVYGDWERRQDRENATEELRREKDLDDLDSFYGIGDQTSADADPNRGVYQRPSDIEKFGSGA
jgi:hypothetical protein